MKTLFVQFLEERGTRMDDRVAFKRLQIMVRDDEPEWANVHYTKPDFQAISYYSAPKKKVNTKVLDEVDPELLETFKNLGISIDEQKKLAGVAVILL